MKKGTITIIAIVAVVAIAILWGISVNNKLVTSDENVQKEQGIIGQEIKMYEDSAEWTVFINLLKG